MPITKTLPTLGITDKAFRYRHSTVTDIRKTFARIRREQAALQASKPPQASRDLETTTVVPMPITGRGAR